MAYVIMRCGSSPVAIIIPTPVAVRATRKQANEFIKGKKCPNEYYVRYVLDDQEAASHEQ